jgi:hypothetical protein
MMRPVAIHRYVSYIIGVVVTFMAVTGGVWTLAYRSLGFSKSSVRWLVNWHQGDIFNSDPTGIYIKAPFCVAVMCGVVLLGISGLLQYNTRSLKSNRNIYRRNHQIFAIMGGLPLIFGAVTGGVWALLRLVAMSYNDEQIIDIVLFAFLVTP